jgi:hypothetical protein
MSRWGYPFFGLTDKYKIQLHELIFELCHFGKLEYDAVYSMPIQYRTFYIKKLANIKEKEKQQYEASSGKNEAASQKQVARGPSINRS